MNALRVAWKWTWNTIDALLLAGVLGVVATVLFS